MFVFVAGVLEGWGEEGRLREAGLGGLGEWVGEGDAVGGLVG